MLKIAAALLGYPCEDLQAAVPEIARCVAAERVLRPATQDALAGLLERLAREDLLELQERYVAQFDTGRSTSLNLFEHLHGDSRDRGQAMVDLLAMYRRGGFDLGARELPDYLPVLLEYLSTRTPGEAHEIIDDCAHILRAIGARLLAGGSPYAAVFAALLDLQGEAPLEPAPAPAEESPDADWQDLPVVFGPGAAEHGAQQSRPEFIRFVSKRPNQI